MVTSKKVENFLSDPQELPFGLVLGVFRISRTFFNWFCGICGAFFLLILWLLKILEHLICFAVIKSVENL